MELTAVFLLLIVLVLIVFFVSFPFFDRRRIRAVKGNQEVSSLLAERERLLNALQELDFDQSLGKIPAEDFPLQRSELLQKGAEVLRALDEISSNKVIQAKDDQHALDSKPKPNTPSDDDLESLLASRRAIRKGKTAGFCPKCGKPVLQSDVFCPFCGSELR